jgi:uncharacterized membrane protein
MRLLLNITVALLTLFYPIAIYFGIQHFEPWKIASVLLFFLTLRMMMSKITNQWGKPLLLASIIYCLFVAWSNAVITLRFYPVMVNGVMFSIFFSSLFSSATVVERIARLQHPLLPVQGVIYTRRVTQLWCLFFILNGSVAFGTAVWGSFELWSLYNGLIAYLLMGLLFAGEYIVRIKTQKYAR